MPIIKVSTIINKDKQTVYNLLKDIQRFPTFMQDIKKLDIIERDKNKLLTSWEVWIDGANVIWKEEDVFNDEEMSLRFKMIKGDYNSYKGQWRLENMSRGTKISIFADFDWGIPVFEKLVGHILETKARKALRSMLHALKRESEKK